ncbi:MAG TPA: hypothetical protein VFA20_15470 [Myxococcaceae bacterium]|nr:hypothetical protein [Myxococcaceae bacterium]
MKQVIRVGIALVAALGLVGCGGRPLAPGKEAAAGALFQSSRGTMGTPGMLAQLWNAGAGTQTQIKVGCPRGGSVAININVDASNPGTSIAYDLTYDGCNFDGHTGMRGTLHMTFDLVTGSTSVQLALHLKGRIEFSGDISDFIDVDVTETVVQNDLTAGSTNVAVTLNGSITDRSGTYAFANETLTIDGSGFTPAPDPNAG